MFLSGSEKSSKEKALTELLSKIDEMDAGKIGKKPVAAEVSVTSLSPMDEESELEDELGDMESDKMESGSISPEQIAMIEELYNKFCRG